ncbi:M48 family metalloprotease [Gemmatimonadota bacterium]
MPITRRIPRSFVAAACIVCFSVSGCARNPVTGGYELMLISESQEIAMGQDYDPQIVGMFGLHDDPGLQEAVSGIGQQMAARSERPNLPWTFRVVDDPLINAFAVPGGFVYVTRGILAHFDSEAQLAAVLGHEIGHITARHSASQMSRQQIMQVGMGVGVMLAPQLADFAGLASAGLSVLFLKFSRDNERQADDLGFRYMTDAGYDPRGMVDVFVMLNRVSGGHEGSGVPNWLSTHPDPGDRRERIGAAISASGRDYSNAREARNEYLRRLDGMIFGENPRDGFFRDALFLHPDLAFQFAFPAGWITVNQTQAVIGQSPSKDAMIQLRLSDATDVVAGARAFAAQEGLTSGQVSSNTINGLRTASADFTAQSEQAALHGNIMFIEFDGRVFEILGLSTEQQWAGYATPIMQSLRSFERLTDQTALSVQPARISMVTLDRSMTLRQFNERYPSSVPIETVALINQAEEYTAFMEGDLVKRVVGGAN